jgi:hypothetical protein
MTRASRITPSCGSPPSKMNDTEGSGGSDLNPLLHAPTHSTVDRSLPVFPGIPQFRPDDPNVNRPWVFNRSEDGKLTPETRRTIRTINQIFHQRRLLTAHIFFNPQRWHIFYFDQRDMDASGQNHLDPEPVQQIPRQAGRGNTGLGAAKDRYAPSAMRLAGLGF